MTNEKWDAIVVGGRCAGALTALCLARGGMRVLVLERGAPGTDTLSTHALMRTGTHQLQRWGVLHRLVASGAPVIRSTTFHYAAEPTTVPIHPRGDVPGLIAPRRYVLDTVLLDAARSAGVRVDFGARVCGLRWDARGRVAGVVVKTRQGVEESHAAGFVIGADGARSTVASLVGAGHSRVGRFCAATLYAYVADLRAAWPGPDGYHWFFGPRASASLIPTNDGLTCLAASVPASSPESQMLPTVGAAYFRWLEGISPALADGVAQGKVVGKFRRFAGTRGFMRNCQGPGWALVGDASAFRDPATAHGISDALRDAELLAAALLVGSAEALGEYERLRDEISTPLFDVTDRIASFQWTLDELRTLHTELSAHMKRELRELESYQRQVADPLFGRAARCSVRCA